MKRRKPPTRADFIELLHKTRSARPLRPWAKDLGISTTFLVELLNGRRDPGDKVLAQFGIRRVVEVRYEWLDESE